MVTISIHNQKEAMLSIKLRRRCRSDLIRLSFLLISAVFVIFLLSKSKTNDQDFMSDDIFGSSNDLDRNNEALIKSNPTVIKQLSAKEAELYHKLNPVIEGWGEDGKGVYIKDPEEELLSKKQFDKGAFNVYISDRISPNRSVPDPRPAECSEISYDYSKLGTSSIVIIFTDEIWSALIRTIWSVWNRTPHRLLKEIILVDDASKQSELKDTLRNYCSHYFGDKVKLFRSDKRIGLIRARLLGAKAASGDVIVFLDSHCETTNGWLEPLMATIAENPKHVVCPVIDVISDKSLAYNYGTPYYFQIGSFTWSGHFTWMDLDEDKLLANPTKPVASPTMAGGLLAVNRDYFFSIGSYDAAMEIWGGENLEMSFRVWQCGGNLSIHPCSHVGHIFRDYHPYSFQGKDTHGINTLRTMLVWMDPEYQRYFFMHRPDMLKINAGDLTDRLELKKRLQCKSFKWYLDNIFEGRKFIYDKNATGWGTVRNLISGLCLDSLNENEEKSYLLGLFTCEARPDDQYTNQFLTLTADGELRREEVCATSTEKDGTVKMEKCLIAEYSTKKSRAGVIQAKKKQKWEHLRNGLIVNGALGQCLSTKRLKSMSRVKLVDCNPYDPYQKWKFQKYSSVNFT